MGTQQAVLWKADKLINCENGGLILGMNACLQKKKVGYGGGIENGA